MRVDIDQISVLEVIDKLAVTDRNTVVLGRLLEGKIRVTSSSWDDAAKVTLKDQIFDARNIDGQIRLSRKSRFPDEGDPSYVPYDPYGPGEQDVEDEGESDYVAAVIDDGDV